jgi:hypothetical protein
MMLAIPFKRIMKCSYVLMESNIPTPLKANIHLPQSSYIYSGTVMPMTTWRYEIRLEA